MTNLSSSAIKSLLKDAREALDSGNFDAALTACRKVLSADRNNYQAYVFVGVAASRKQELLRAIQAYDRAIALKPNAPLAYKGLADALAATDAGTTELRVRRARALLSLAKLSPQHATDACREGALILYSLVELDRSLTSEAIEAFNNLALISDAQDRSENGHGALLPNDASNFDCVIACLAAGDVDYYHLDQGNVYDRETLLHALNKLEALRMPLGVKQCDRRAQILLVDYVIQGAQSGSRSVEQCIDVLSSLGEFDVIVDLLERDQAQSCATYDRLLQLTSKAWHFKPFCDINSRQAAAFALVHCKETRSSDSAFQYLTGCNRPRRHKRRLDITASRTEDGVEQKTISPFNFVVMTLLHLEREEYKKTLLVAKDGILCCQNLQSRTFLSACLHVLAAQASSKCHQFRQAVQFYEAAVQQTETGAMSRPRQQRVSQACHLGVMHSITSWKGVFSAELREAISYARTSDNQNVSNLANIQFLWLENVNSDAKVDDLADSVAEAVKLAENDVSRDATKVRLPLENVFLDESFSVSCAEVASYALVRLAHTYIARVQLDKFETCKSALMQAANFDRGSSDPFAYLGFLFESQAYATSPPLLKMIDRAKRCYEKCVATDVTHPWASRHLARLLLRRDENDSAFQVAKSVTDKSPNASWAWNIVGWWRYESRMLPEAASAFRSALRFCNRNDDAAWLMLLNAIPINFKDTNFEVEIDSWRGLSLVYQGQRRLSPAVECLSSALDIVRSSEEDTRLPKDMHGRVTAYSESMRISKASLQTALGKSLDALNTLEGQCDNPRHTRESVINNDGSVKHGEPSNLAIDFAMAEAYLSLANEHWNCGWFFRATKTRLLAAKRFERCTRLSDQSSMNVEIDLVLSRLGDACRYAATHEPEQLSTLLSKQEIKQISDKATCAYAKALHFAPWKLQQHGVALGRALSLEAKLLSSLTTAELAVRVVLSSGGDCDKVGAAFAVASEIDNREQYARVALGLLNVFHDRTSVGKENRAGIRSVVASLYAKFRDSKNGGEWAIAALESDPTDWRAWHALGDVRQSDGENGHWPWTAITSTVEAFQEADRLGAGPEVSRQLAECLERRSNALKSQKNKEDQAATDAAYANAMYARSGMPLSEFCAKVVEQHLYTAESNRITSVDNTCDNFIHVQSKYHLYPFSAELSAIARNTFTNLLRA